MTTRQQVRIFAHDRPNQVVAEVPLPAVFTAPIRSDIVHFVHYNLNKNRRQPYAVNKDAGMMYNAESWGTGRAVARVPRVGGSGTHRSGQAAFANICRGGRMFNPTTIWRRWHRKVNLTQRRHAVASAVAASAIPSLVLARGHRVNQVPELPLVVDKLNIEKTTNLIKTLNKFGLEDEMNKVKTTRKIRVGQGKYRNRRYVLRKGPLIVYDSDNYLLAQSARNIPGVEICHVERLNILQLAPGGHMGRFIIWTQKAFETLNRLFGTADIPATLKKGYLLERPLMNNANLARLVNSDEVQSVVRAKRRNVLLHGKRRANPLKNRELMSKINPYDKVRKQDAKKEEEHAKANRDKKLKDKKVVRKKYRKQGRKFIGNVRASIAQANNKSQTDYRNYIESIKIGEDTMKDKGEN
ncbi:MAG: 50S ribosomal protein L4 [bacterium]|nr:50S ribosomal protein L4 [bacterium]